MPLHPPVQVSERILSYGGTGAGKTHDYFTVADLAAKTKSDAAFYVIDTDDTVGRMLATDFPQCHPDNGGNVHLYSAYDWEDVTDNLTKLRRLVRPQDWLIVDMITPVWQWAQDWYSDQIFGKDRMQFFMEARQAQKKGSPFDGRKDWSIINGLYRNFIQDLCFKSRCNVYATAAADVINAESDAKEILSLFLKHGFKPKGQKETAHSFHTVILKTVDRAGVRRLSNPKDRGREEVMGVALGNEEGQFVSKYLLGIAGWKP